MKKGIARKMRKETNAENIQNDYNKELEWICENSALFPLLLLLLVLVRSLTLTTVGLLLVHTIPNGIPLTKSKEGLEIEILLDPTPLVVDLNYHVSSGFIIKDVYIQGRKLALGLHTNIALVITIAVTITIVVAKVVFQRRLCNLWIRFDCRHHGIFK